MSGQFDTGAKLSYGHLGTNAEMSLVRSVLGPNYLDTAHLVVRFYVLSGTMCVGLYVGGFMCSDCLGVYIVTRRLLEHGHKNPRRLLEAAVYLRPGVH